MNNAGSMVRRPLLPRCERQVLPSWPLRKPRTRGETVTVSCLFSSFWVASPAGADETIGASLGGVGWLRFDAMRARRANRISIVQRMRADAGQNEQRVDHRHGFVADGG